MTQRPAPTPAAAGPLLHIGFHRVLVLAYKQFADDPRAFVQAIARFCGLSPTGEQLAVLPHAKASNPSMSALGLAIKRRANAVFGARRAELPYSLLPSKRAMKAIKRRIVRLDAMLPLRIVRASNRRLDRIIAARVAGYYAASNRRTAELSGLNLRRMGYELD